MHYQEWPPADGRWEVAPNTTYLPSWAKVRHFVTITHPVPLSPIWEAYITGIWFPRARRLVQDKAYPLHGEKLCDYERAITFHPFNMSDPKVNALRSRIFWQDLFTRRGGAGRKVLDSDIWWPVGPGQLEEAIRKEREEIERLGYITGAGATYQEWEAEEKAAAARQGRGSGSASTSLKRRRWG